MDEDRRAILVNALAEADKGVERFADSKYMYFAAAEAAKEWFYLTGERNRLEAARLLLSAAEERLLDPDLRDRLAELADL